MITKKQQREVLYQYAENALKTAEAEKEIMELKIKLAKEISKPPLQRTGEI